MRRRSDKRVFQLAVLSGLLATVLSIYAIYSLSRFNVFIDRAYDALSGMRTMPVIR